MLLSNLNLLATAPGGVARLRELILTLAVQGKLVPQDPADEPASRLLQKIRAEKYRLIAEGKIKKDKPLAAIAEEEKPFGLPVGWEWVRLGEVVEVLDSLRKPVTKEERQPGPYPYYGASGIVDYVSAYLFDEPLVLVGEDGAKWGTGDKTAFPISGKTWVNNHAHVLRPLRTALVDIYLVNFLTARDLSEFITGMTVPKLNQARLTSIPVALPPLAEQSRIVARVEELMRLCDALQAKGQLEATQHAQLLSTLLGTLTASATPDELANNWQRVAQHFDLLLDRPEAIDALEQTLLQLAVRGLLVPQDPADEPASVLLQKIRAEKDRLITEGKIKKDKPLPPVTDEEKPFELPVGWEWVRLQQAYDVRDGTHDTPKYQSTGFPLVTSKNLYRGVLDLSDVKLISPVDHEQISARSRVDRDDILFAMIGSIGNPVIVDTDAEFSIKNVALFKYYAASLSCPKYLLFVLQSEAAGMKERAAGGVQSFVSLGQLRSTVVAFPPLAEQSRIVTRVTQLRRLCADLRQRLAEREVVQARLAEALVQQVA
ncbi:MULTISPECIES: restriction endonuclease subunit S [Comamonas]|uniref:restriction endonuclease subunit S n=1 Tax=Comamonas TaxID=283 RepID=UPI00257F8E40|nr:MULTISPECIES: restriction endonuclease subunit S [Comamonas]